MEIPIENQEEIGAVSVVGIRDIFAASALIAVIVGQVCSAIGMPESAEGHNRILPPEDVAKLAYKYTDAMLAASSNSSEVKS